MGLTIAIAIGIGIATLPFFSGGKWRFFPGPHLFPRLSISPAGKAAGNASHHRKLSLWNRIRRRNGGPHASPTTILSHAVDQRVVLATSRLPPMAFIQPLAFEPKDRVGQGWAGVL